jgi:hypothetical protein
LGGVAITGDILSSFYNPAGIYGLTGISFATSFSEGGEALEGGDYSYAGFGVPAGSWGAVGLGWYGFDYEGVVDGRGQKPVPYSGTGSVYAFSLAGEPWADLYVGANLNILRHGVSEEKETVVWPDVGLIKMLTLSGWDYVGHRIVLGTSLANLTNTGVQLPDGSGDLPVTFRLGASYQLLWASQSWMNRIRLLRSTLHIEYRNLLDSEHNDGVRTGIELWFLEMAAVRFGYYLEDLGDPVDPAGDRLEKTTLGLGLGAPVYRLTGSRVPLRITLDWATVDSRTTFEETKLSDRYSVWTLALDWRL